MTSSARRYSMPQAVMGIALCFLLMGAVYYYSAMPPGSPGVEAAVRAEGRAVVRPPEPHATVKRVRKPIEEPKEVDCRSVQCSGPPKDCPRGQGAFKHGGRTEDGCCPLWECHDIGQAPHEFRVLLRTSKGDIIIKMVREWAPKGVDQVYKMIKSGFFEPTSKSLDHGIGMFRTVPDFVIQFGIHGDPEESAYWRQQRIDDDPVIESNKRGRLTFASAGKNTRTTQLFLNLRDNTFLDKSGFSPLGEIISGMEVLNDIEMKYKEKPNQGSIQQEGNAYLTQNFPDLDYISHAEIVEES